MKSGRTLPGRVVDWGEGVAAMLSARWWAFFVAALLLALGCAELAYVWLDLPQQYQEFVVGAIAWTYQNKFHDYAVLYAFVIAFMTALIAIGSLAARLHRDFGAEGVDQFHDSVLLLCAPAALALGAMLTTRNDVMWLLRLADAFLLVALLLVWMLVRKGPDFWSAKAERLFDALRTLLLFMVIAMLAVSAVGVAVNRLGARIHSEHWIASTDVVFWTERIVVGFALICCLLVRQSPNALVLRDRVRRMVLAGQMVFPLFFLCLVPPAWVWTEAGTLATGYRLTPFAKIFVIACIAVAYFDLHRRKMASQRAGPATASMQLISVSCAVAVVLFLKTAPAGLPTLHGDDYHFGEVLVPWWSWFEKGLLPFRDYVPARGLINYLPGFVNSLMFGGIATSVEATYPFIYVVIASVLVSVFRPVLGLGVTLVALLVGPSANGLGEIDLVVSAFVCAFAWGVSSWKPGRWLVMFTVCAAGLLLFAPGQGALALVACSPLALMGCWRLFQEGRNQWAKVLLVLTAAIALVMPTPLGSMLIGAIRYGAEQSAINSVAHGVNWSASFGRASANPWAFELVRASWLLVTLWAALVTFRALFLKASQDRSRILAFAVPIFLVTLLFIVRAAGRIDEGGSRLAIAGSWAVCLLLPLLIFSSSRRVMSVHLIAWLALAGLVMPYSGGFAPSYASNFDPVRTDALSKTPTTLSLDINRLGLALSGAEHVARIVGVRRVLDAVLDPGETYLDLTSRHAMYYYVDRKPPIETGAIYNLVGEKQQLRAIEVLRKIPVPAILIEGDNLLFDGTPSSLRSNLIYREVMLASGYKVVTVGQHVWLIRAERVGRLSSLSSTQIQVQDMGEAVGPTLDRIFAPKNLKDIPASWGRSAESLTGEYERVTAVAMDTASTVLNDVQRIGEASFVVTGDDPFIRLDISQAHLSGQAAGLVSFDFSCENKKAEPTIGVYWGTSANPEKSSNYLELNGKQGKLIVPMDSTPSWLLAPDVRTIRFDIEDRLAQCREFSVRNVEMLRRTAAATATAKGR